MTKYQVGDEVYLGASYWCGYTVMEIKPNNSLDVLISSSGSMLDAFWVSSKELSFIC